MPRILTIRTHTPGNCVTTQSMLDAFGDRLSPELTASLSRIGVVQRYAVISNYVRFVTGRERARPTTTATRLAAEALTEAIRDAAIEASDIGLLVAVTNTQSKILPGLAAEVMAELDKLLAREIRLVNEQGQGCSGLLKGIEIASWYLRVYPQRKAAVVAVEVATPFCGGHPSRPFVSLCEAQALADENARQPALEATLALIQAFLFGDGAVAM
ncbi:MAG: hypothetical protein GY856_51470, partial [bacterium]|nr:hypothetical protein [bacterium]